MKNKKNHIKRRRLVYKFILLQKVLLQKNQKWLYMTQILISHKNISNYAVSRKGEWWIPVMLSEGSHLFVDVLISLWSSTQIHYKCAHKHQCMGVKISNIAISSKEFFGILLGLLIVIRLSWRFQGPTVGSFFALLGKFRWKLSSWNFMFSCFGLFVSINKRCILTFTDF